MLTSVSDGGKGARLFRVAAHLKFACWNEHHAFGGCAPDLGGMLPRLAQGFLRRIPFVAANSGGQEKDSTTEMYECGKVDKGFHNTLSYHDLRPRVGAN